MTRFILLAVILLLFSQPLRADHEETGGATSGDATTGGETTGGTDGNTSGGAGALEKRFGELDSKFNLIKNITADDPFHKNELVALSPDGWVCINPKTQNYTSNAPGLLGVMKIDGQTGMFIKQISGGEATLMRKPSTDAEKKKFISDLMKQMREDHAKREGVDPVAMFEKEKPSIATRSMKSRELPSLRNGVFTYKQYEVRTLKAPDGSPDYIIKVSTIHAPGVERDLETREVCYLN